MWKPIYDPGPWGQYLKKKENKGLPLMEVKQKYLKEQLEFEDFRGTVSSTLSPSLASSVASAVGSKPNPTPTPTSIYPPKLYVQVELQRLIGGPFTRVIEYIKYEEVGDVAWNGKPVYFRGENLVDDPNTYDYDPNGVFGDYIRYNIEGDRWEIVGCEFDSKDECNVEIISFGVPIPDPASPLAWSNLIGNWDFINFEYGVYGCYTATWVGPGSDPRSQTPILIGFNTYTEDPGTATFGTTYSYQENGQYVPPVGVYNTNTSLDCGEEPQPCNSLFNQIRISGLVLNEAYPQLANISDEGDLVNGRRYWDKLISAKGGPDTLYTIKWNGNNWEIAQKSGSNPEIIISTNTNHTGEVPYNCDATGDTLMTWTGNAPYENGFTTEGTGGVV